jgi:succinate-semialdehyde dehydrogenase/glutarate-semialdehyde dehydrogenase
MIVQDPATLDTVGECADIGPEDAGAFVDTAQAAFLDWARTPADRRSTILGELATLIECDARDMVTLIVRESGKPRREAAREVASAVAFLRWNAEEGRRAYGQWIPSPSTDTRMWTIRQPVGVVLAITPWNYPLNTLCRKIGPALAAGCTVISKPAPETPLSAVRLANLARDAGFPDGVLQVVTTSRAPEVVAVWMGDPRVRKIAFTGSTEVGRTLLRSASETIKRVSLELGGNAPVLVFADADLERAADAIAASRYRHAGQTCICAQRIYVEASVKQPLVQALTSRIGHLRVGNPMDEETDVGPLIHDRALGRVTEHIEDAVKNGAHLRIGGQKVRVSEEQRGCFFAPTLLDDITPASRIMREETFGPVLAVQSFENEADALARANATEYGLAAYVFTRDLARSIRVVEALEFGNVGVNSVAIIAPQLAFGGWKSSGIGRENGAEGLAEYLETKAAIVSVS